MNDLIVWVDCEMTGLDLRRDALIEVAMLVTDGDLAVLGEGIDVVIKPPPETIDAMNDVVRTMHTESGLLDELADGVTLAEAQDALMSELRRHVPTPGKAPLGGNSVFVDRGYLARDMPEFEQHLHYRCIDVSAIKELVRRWYPKVYFASPPKTGHHRALGDIQDSIAELKYYRETIFVPLPGPANDTARAAAARITELTSAGTASTANPADPADTANTANTDE